MANKKINECDHTLGLVDRRWEEGTEFYTQAYTKTKYFREEDIDHKFNYCPDCGKRVNKEA